MCRWSRHQTSLSGVDGHAFALDDQSCDLGKGAVASYAELPPFPVGRWSASVPARPSSVGESLFDESGAWLNDDSPPRMTDHKREEMRTAVRRILPHAEFVGFVLVAVPGWRGYADLFESADGKACAWRSNGDTGHVHAVLYKHPIDSPLAAIEEWLESQKENQNAVLAAAAQRALDGAQFVARIEVVGDRWQGPVSTFKAQDAKVYAWFADGEVHAVLESERVRSPLDAVSEWLDRMGS